MNKQHIQKSDILKIKEWSKGIAIDGDIIIFDNINEAPIPKAPRLMNYILVGFCRKGEIRYSVDMKEQAVKPGDIILITDRQVVEEFVIPPDAEGQCIVMSMPFIYEVIRDMSDLSAIMLFSKDHPVVALTPQEAKNFNEYFLFIKQKISETGNPFRKRLVGALVLAMFYDLSNVIQRVQQSTIRRQTRAEIIFTDFIRLVEEHFLSERRVSWYAQKLCITPKYLSESIKQVSKRSPNEWIDKYVMLEIKLQLKNSNKNIKEIAQQLNFPNQSFLGKFFKEHEGISPSKYRRG